MNGEHNVSVKNMYLMADEKLLSELAANLINLCLDNQWPFFLEDITYMFRHT